jgi:hypothetical protein
MGVEIGARGVEAEPIVHQFAADDATRRDGQGDGYVGLALGQAEKARRGNQVHLDARMDAAERRQPRR